MLTWGERREQRSSVALPPTAFVGVVAAFVVLYLGAAFWAFRLASGDSVLVWFPPAAVAMSGLALFGVRLLPVAFVCEVVSTAFVSGFGSDFGAAWTVVNASVIVGAYWAAAWLVRRIDVDLGLRRLRDVLWLGGATMFAGPLLAAVGGTLVQVQVGLIDAADLGAKIAVFWLGDAVAAAALGPVLVLAGDAFLYRRRPVLSDRSAPLLELLVELVVPGLSAAVLFALGDPPLRFLYLAIVPIALVAIRHGVTSATLANVGFASVIVVGAFTVTPDVLDRSDTQLLMAVVVIGGLVLGTIESQRRDLAESIRNLSLIVESSPDLVGIASLDGAITYLNPAGRTALGIDPTASDRPVLAASFYPQDGAVLDEAVRAALRDGVWSGDNVLLASDGRTVPVSQVMVTHYGPDGLPHHLSTVCRDVTEERRLEAQLGRHALYDDATGLANRALLTEHLGRALAEASDSPGRKVAVLLVDLRRFRLVNESLGYRAGDVVLAEIADRLRACTRARDLVARHGGDVFAVVLDAVSDELEAIDLGGVLIAALSAPVHVADRELVLDARVGIALLDGSRADPLDAVRAAQIALSRAKDSDARFALFDLEMDQRAHDRLEMETDLRAAIDSPQWWMAYQPVVSLATRKVESCEALLRWDHPARGALPPLSVVALAESTGLIVPLGRRILERVCQQTCAWHELGHRTRVAVNVSGRQLQERGFADDALRVIEASGLAPQAITVEVTETVFTSALDGSRRELEALRAAGCQVAMDDFGTGYSSLAGLRDLPLDVLKLDRSFITDLAVSARAAAMVEAVVGVAKALDLRLVAEGVEEEAQLELLERLGCDDVQGFVFARPMPAQAFEELLGVGSGNLTF